MSASILSLIYHPPSNYDFLSQTESRDYMSEAILTYFAAISKLTLKLLKLKKKTKATTKLHYN